MKLIAFTGKKQTGKSTACSYLENKYGFTRVNFKDALIKEIKQNFPDLLEAMVMSENVAFGHDDRTSVEELFTTKPRLMRTLMQNYGTEVRRKDNPNYWVKQWEYEIKAPFSNDYMYKNVTVDDCRFLNEAQAVKRNGGVIVHLVRGDMQHTDGHVSEMEMDNIVPDYVIHCVKDDLTHLHTELDKIMVQYPQ